MLVQVGFVAERREGALRAVSRSPVKGGEGKEVPIVVTPNGDMPDPDSGKPGHPDKERLSPSGALGRLLPGNVHPHCANWSVQIGVKR